MKINVSDAKRQKAAGASGGSHGGGNHFTSGSGKCRVEVQGKVSRRIVSEIDSHGQGGTMGNHDGIGSCSIRRFSGKLKPACGSAVNQDKKEIMIVLIGVHSSYEKGSKLLSFDWSTDFAAVAERAGEPQLPCCRIKITSSS